MFEIELTEKNGDDFDAEVEALSRNREFMAFLEERSRETKRIPLAEVKKRLGLE